MRGGGLVATKPDLVGRRFVDQLVGCINHVLQWSRSLQISRFAPDKWWSYREANSHVYFTYGWVKHELFLVVHLEYWYELVRANDDCTNLLFDLANGWHYQWTRAAR